MTDTESPVGLDALPLVTPSLRIRRMLLDDARDLFALSNEEAYRLWLPSQVYRDESHARSVLQFLVDQYSSPAHPRWGPYVLVIEHAADRQIIGHVGFSPFGDDVEVGFAIAQRYQRQGLAVEALAAACSWAHATFQLERILGITSAANLASKRTLGRAGFVHQGDRILNFQGTEQVVSVHALAAPGAAPANL